MGGYETRRPAMPLDVFVGQYGFGRDVLGRTGAALVVDAGGKEQYFAEQGIPNAPKNANVKYIVPMGDTGSFVEKLAKAAGYSVSSKGDGTWKLKNERGYIIELRKTEASYEGLFGRQEGTVLEIVKSYLS